MNLSFVRPFVPLHSSLPLSLPNQEEGKKKKFLSAEKQRAFNAIEKGINDVRQQRVCLPAGAGQSNRYFLSPRSSDCELM